MRHLENLLRGIGSALGGGTARPYSMSGGFSADYRHLVRDVRTVGGDIRKAAGKAKSRSNVSSSNR